MAFWRQKLMNNTSNLLQRYKKGAQREVLTSCIALQFRGGRVLTGWDVRHQELQQRTSAHLNAVIAKIKWVCTQNLCLCLWSLQSSEVPLRSFLSHQRGLSQHTFPHELGQKQQFFGSKSRPLHGFGTSKPVFPSAMQLSRGDFKGSRLTIFLSEFKGDFNFYSKLTCTFF